MKLKHSSNYNYESGAYNVHCWFCQKKIKNTQGVISEGRWYCSEDEVDQPNKLIPGVDDYERVPNAQQEPDPTYLPDIAIP